MTLRAVAQTIRNWMTDEKGATATEYAVMLALVIVVCIAAITTLGVNLGSKYTTIDGTLFP